MAAPYDLEVKRLVLDGQCVAFVGAGLSMPPALLWVPTVEQIANDCGVPFDTAGTADEVSGRCLDVIDTCLEKDEAVYVQALRRQWPQHTSTTRTAMPYVLRLPFQAILTTNFDPWIRQLARQSEFGNWQKYPMLALHHGLENRLFFVHGCFESDDLTFRPNELVFGRKSFEEAYDRSLVPAFLLHVLTYKNVLFIGFNPAERHFAQLLRQSKQARRSIERMAGELPKRFVLLPQPSIATPEAQAKHDAYVDELRALDVAPVLYLPKGPGYQGLEELLMSWIEEGKSENRSPTLERII